MQDDISRMSKKELERALRSQLQSGQWVNQKAIEQAILKDRADHETRAKRFFELVFEIEEAAIAIQLMIVIIDTTATVGRGQAMLDQLQGKAGLLAEAYTELLLQEDQFGLPPDEELRNNVTTRLEGIRMALNNNDGGEYLRQIAAGQGELFAEMKAKREAAIKSGPHKQDAIEYLCKRAAKIYANSKGTLSQEDVTTNLFEQMGSENPAYKGLELKAWEKLRDWDLKGTANDNLWRNIRRRGMVPDFGHN